MLAAVQHLVQIVYSRVVYLSLRLIRWLGLSLYSLAIFMFCGSAFVFWLFLDWYFSPSSPIVLTIQPDFILCFSLQVCFFCSDDCFRVAYL